MLLGEIVFIVVSEGLGILEMGDLGYILGPFPKLSNVVLWILLLFLVSFNRDAPLKVLFWLILLEVV